MAHDKNPRILFATANGQSWLQRIIVFVLAATIVALAFFFLTIALIAGALLAAIITVRWWWLTRKLRAAATQDTFDGEYTVIEHSSRESSAPTGNKRQ